MKTQLRLEAFYTFNERFAKIRSKRIKKAVKGITGSQSSGLLDDSVQDGSKIGKKIRENPSKQEIPTNKIGSTAARNESNDTGKTTMKQSRGRRVHKRALSDVESVEPPVQAGRKQDNLTGSRKNGRGRGRKKGLAIGRRRGRREVQENPGSEISGTSSSDCNGGSEDEVPAQKLEGSNEVRRVRFSLSCNRKSIVYMYVVVLVEIEQRPEPLGLV